MKLSKWAKLQGVTYRTAYRWFRDNQIQGAKQTPSGTILIDETPVSMVNTGDNLSTHIDRLKNYCIAKGYQ